MLRADTNPSFSAIASESESDVIRGGGEEERRGEEEEIEGLGFNTFYRAQNPVSLYKARDFSGKSQ